MPRASHYHYFILLTVFYSSYLSLLECSMRRSSGFGDYSTSEIGSLDSEERFEDTMVAKLARFESNDHLSNEAELLIYSSSPSSKPLVKRKRKPSNMEESFVSENSPLSELVEIENYKRKCVSKEETDIPSLSIFDISQTMRPASKNVLPASKVSSFKGFSTSCLEPIEAKFSTQSSSSSFSSLNLNSSTGGSNIISPTPLKNGFLSLPRRNDQKHTNLVGLSPESVTFSPIPNFSATKIIREVDEDVDNENSVLDDELANIFESFALIDIDDEGCIKGGRPL